MKKLILLSFVSCNILLTGCATSTQSNTDPTLNGQHQQQLAALIAGSEYLKENCQRSDIPAMSVLTKTAISEAKKKQWPVDETLSDTLPTEARNIINRLNQDPTPVAQKCAYFNQSLATFIEASRRQ
ncbi:MULTISPECIES: type II secretion system pilot lipoprotein GspS [Serratia]|uniref:Type II secretion system pilot lipoprotein GspS n=1 Tax=Serratia proteamaculans TaxID=28151 RepID=A0A7U0RLC0_SERPR|nr:MULTISPECIES: type II secretion system pilot lipoprotein GspS [Serratia]MBO1502431.1 type II secretion system pilot lipoprotein GspS [Serratia proteamaculans]MDW5511034.1 type II secretion system pilot lipoprotein GspS [Serratia proteamaculans]QQX51256.1 type II secretion system pilot lipoprotein GspS [Serratia proteamaculans]